MNVQLSTIKLRQLRTVPLFFCWQTVSIKRRDYCRPNQPYTLVGPPVRGLVLDPLAVYSSTSMYSFWTFTNFAKNPNVECGDLV